MRELTPEQIAEILATQRAWEEGSPPCQIPHFHPFNPCLPQREDDGKLHCCTCGLQQRKAITRGQ